MVLIVIYHHQDPLELTDIISVT